MVHTIQHLHVLVFVKSTYFSGKSDNYISQSQTTEFWKKALKIDYTPIDVKQLNQKPLKKKKGVVVQCMKTAKYR